MKAHSHLLEEAVTISALQHYSYCPRQCALIHVEQTFDENIYTLRGRAVHEQVDTPDSHLADGVQVERALPSTRCFLSCIPFWLTIAVRLWKALAWIHNWDFSMPSDQDDPPLPLISWRSSDLSSPTV